MKLKIVCDNCSYNNEDIKIFEVEVNHLQDIECPVCKSKESVWINDVIE